MKQIKRDFAPADRYVYDFGLCTTNKGWAQLDTSQDAHYFGQWINPTSRKILCYCEGDLILTSLDTDAELTREVYAIKEWNETQGHRFMGIDPGFNADLKEACIAAGLAQFFHDTEN